MLTIPEALEYQDAAAVAKVASTRRPVAYAIQSMLAGAYIGVAVVLMVSAAGPFKAEGSAATKLISGLVFGVALTLVLVAGGELATSNMMTLTQGAARGSITWLQGGATLAFCFVANIAGAFAFATLVHFSGVLAPGTAGGDMIAGMLAAKGEEPTTELFFRAVLCNILVCLAIWSAVRLTSEVAKLIVIFWCLLAFITSGFEHVVANMTTFGLGLVGGLPEATWGQFARNMSVVGLGNLVGGGLIVGLGYAVVAGPLRRRATETVGVDATV
ncbi:formate/nitrite transporter family protein [Sanguibacter antarcticus]|uniref:Nitrite transporter NirC n=1 Tax=Sanguibacter antarcticus TaxID=372484 RepID=A0A2A9EAA7_9MICO|nr:formate/nitrite transporter family protein [Sanguibacter antarcticus]PFG35150.1 nitrite transporter NirC [Sanguibacter antarcticus]